MICIPLMPNELIPPMPNEGQWRSSCACEPDPRCSGAFLAMTFSMTMPVMLQGNASSFAIPSGFGRLGVSAAPKISSTANPYSSTSMVRCRLSMTLTRRSKDGLFSIVSRCRLHSVIAANAAQQKARERGNSLRFGHPGMRLGFALPPHCAYQACRSPHEDICVAGRLPILYIVCNPRAGVAGGSKDAELDNQIFRKPHNQLHHRTG